MLISSVAYGQTKKKKPAKPKKQVTVIDTSNRNVTIKTINQTGGQTAAEIINVYK